MNTKILLFLLLVRLYVAESTYAEDVETFFQTFKGNGWQSCIDVAKGKMSKYVGDKKYAIGIINIYTQGCKYEDENFFFLNLNAQLRSGNPGEIWKTAGDLINKAISIVGTKNHPTLYRGISHDPGQLKSGDTYMFNAITSTSTVASTSGLFGWDATLFIMKNVKGAVISKYSEFGWQAEVLVKSTMIFTVARDPVTDATDIQKIKKPIGMNSYFTVQRIIYLDWLGDCDTLKEAIADASKPCMIREQCKAHAAGASSYGWTIISYGWTILKYSMYAVLVAAVIGNVIAVPPIAPVYVLGYAIYYVWW